MPLALPICENNPSIRLPRHYEKPAAPDPASEHRTMTAEDPIIEEVEITGHIIDSLILPKVLDTITANGGKFRITNIVIGQARHDPSNAVVEVRAPNEDRMQHILAQIADHGAVPTTKQDCRLAAADMDGAFPEGFYSSTNQRTEIRLNGHWIEIADQEMDCGVVVEQRSRVSPKRESESRTDSSTWSARCIPMTEVEARNVDRHGPQRRPRHPGRTHRRAKRLRLHVERRVDREAERCPDPRNRPRPRGQPPQRRQDAHRRRPRHRPHRQRPRSVPTHPRRLRQQPLRRQRPGHARHRAIALRHQPRRPPRRRQHCRGRPRASPAGDQPHPPLRLDPRRRRPRRPHVRHHVRMREAQRRFPAGRQHPRRWPAARRHHRRAGSPTPNARAASAT